MKAAMFGLTCVVLAGCSSRPPRIDLTEPARPTGPAVSEMVVTLVATPRFTDAGAIEILTLTRSDGAKREVFAAEWPWKPQVTSDRPLTFELLEITRSAAEPGEAAPIWREILTVRDGDTVLWDRSICPTHRERMNRQFVTLPPAGSAAGGSMVRTLPGLAGASRSHGSGFHGLVYRCTQCEEAVQKPLAQNLR